MKKKEALNEKLMYEISTENKRLSEPLNRALKVPWLSDCCKILVTIEITGPPQGHVLGSQCAQPLYHCVACF